MVSKTFDAGGGNKEKPFKAKGLYTCFAHKVN